MIKRPRIGDFKDGWDERDECKKRRGEMSVYELWSLAA